MRKIRKGIIISLIITFVFLIRANIFAFADSIGPISDGDTLHFGSGNPSFAYKTYGGTTPVMCTKFNRSSPGTDGVSCTKTSWDKNRSAAVAYIINSVNKVGGQQAYYYGELAINKLLCAKGDSESCVTSTLNETSQTWYDNALNAYNNSDATIQLSTTELTFTKNGTNYESNEITATGNSYFKNSFTITTTLGTISKISNTDNTYKFKIIVPESSVTEDKNLTVNAKTSINNKSQNYECLEYQTVTPSITESSESAEKSLTATIKKEAKGSIKIIKKGKDSQNRTTELKGVKFIVRNSEGKAINAVGETPDVCNTTGLKDKDMPSACVHTTNTNGEISITGLDIDDDTSKNTYTITELSTISGYIKMSKSVTVTITKNSPSQVKTITNDIVKITISKTDATGKNELKGAKLSILDKDGKVLNKCIFNDSKNLISYSDSKDAKACTWVSTDNEKTMEGLPVGKYYLVEELAPNGYTKSSEKIEIEITEDGAVKDKVIMKNALEVKVPDTLSGRSTLLLAIAMFDVALGIGIYIYVKKNKIEE